MATSDLSHMPYTTRVIRMILDKATEMDASVDVFCPMCQASCTAKYLAVLGGTSRDIAESRERASTRPNKMLAFAACRDHAFDHIRRCSDSRTEAIAIMKELLTYDGKLRFNVTGNNVYRFVFMNYPTEQLVPLGTMHELCR